MFHMPRELLPVERFPPDLATCIDDCQVSPDGRHIMLAYSNSVLSIVDLSTRTQVMQRRFPIVDIEGLASCVYSPDGKKIAFGTGNGSLVTYCLTTGAIEKLLPRGNTSKAQVTQCAYSPNGNLLVASYADSSIYLVNLRSKACVRVARPELCVSSANSICFSPDGSSLAVGFANGTLVAWRLEVNAQSPIGIDPWRLFKEEIHESSGAINDCVFSPCGRLIAVASEDNSVVIVSANDGQERVTLEGHAGEINQCVFSKNGKWLLSGSADNTLRLWDTITWQTRVALVGLTAAVLFIAMLPHGLVMAVDDSGELCVWQLKDYGFIDLGLPSNEIPPIPSTLNVSDSSRSEHRIMHHQPFRRPISVN
ncbi:MAG: hypothetical protein K5Q00_04725 [Gammaproteobacteria bacterium]|nr:hypothetical protein [Gammaproteobacteria bacterium]